MIQSQYLNNFTILLLPILLSCLQPKKEEIPIRELEGWAGSPENPNQRPYEYFYMKYKAKASQKATHKGDKELMQKTCREMAGMLSIRIFLKKMINESAFTGSSPSDSYAPPYNEFFNEILKQKENTINTTIHECKSIAEYPKEWAECECIVYSKFGGGRDAVIGIIKEYENKH